MIWVEHDMQMVADLADRVACSTMASFSPRAPGAVLKDPRVVAAYVG